MQKRKINKIIFYKSILLQYLSITKTITTTITNTVNSCF